MIKLVVTNEKNLELYELEKVHVGENKFGYYLIFLPEMLNDYNLSECEVKLVQVFEDNTSVAINVDTTKEMRPIKEFITLDATSQPQTVTLSVLITHNGDVIGKTNQKTYQVYPTKNATPIDPREELDEIIAELRADKAQLEETVSEQTAEITEKNARITELSNQVDNLTEETTEQAETIERQETTIDQLNSRVPKMYTPPEPIIPESETRVYTPPQNYDGFASFTVTGTSYMNIDLQKWINQSPDDEPFEMIFEKAVRSYIAYGQKKMIKATILTATSIGASAFQNCSSLTEINLPDSLTSIGSSAFQSCMSLTEINLPDSLTSIGNSAFSSCSALTEINFPDSLKTIGTAAFSNCLALTELTLPDSLTSIGAQVFSYCSSLTNLTLAQGFNCNGLNVSYSPLLTAETIVACLEALADRTGQTAYTITFGTTNLNKLTAEQKAIATNKNWNLA
ncbi:MAG: leucine-rich repeat domain-containing protein [Ruminococcus sp.]|nr:leucine-rich repeat domain-containing protein [Ruminococcus sp.]